MSDAHRGPRTDRVRASSNEPAAVGHSVVPAVDAWQEAADRGAGSRTTRTVGETARRPQPPPSAMLPAQLRDELLDWLRGALPNEGCGLLVADRSAADGGVPTRFVGLRNAAASPYRYLIDPQEQLRALLEIDDADEVLWAIVHSHVASPPVPSATDVGLAAYPDALYLIASFAQEPPRLRAWTIVTGGTDEVDLQTQ